MSGTSGNQERNSFLDGQIAQLIGDYLTRLQRYEEAREEYQEASEGYENISPASPDFETAQNNQKVVLGKLNRLPERQKSSQDYRLEKLFAVEKEQSRSVSLKSRVNLSQWLQNVFEESWQTIEQLFAPGEPCFRLGEMGTASSEVLAALTHLLGVTQDEETRWSAAESLWRLAPHNLAGGLRRVKDLGMLIGEHPVTLMVAVLPKTDQMIAVLLRVYPMRNQKYLPAHLQLVVLDEAGKTFLETEARELDNYIQLKFSGSPGEQFSVRVGLGEANITEDFTL